MYKIVIKLRAIKYEDKKICYLFFIYFCLAFQAFMFFYSISKKSLKINKNKTNLLR